MAARRANQAKQANVASNSHLAASASLRGPHAHTATRLKSTSMTNLVSPQTTATSGQSQKSQLHGNLQRPASRNALDNIHKGMNAKFTHVQSKVLLQNIRPQQPNVGATTAASRIPNSSGTLRATSQTHLNSAGGRKTPTPSGGGAKIQQSDRSQLINRIKALQEELVNQERARDELKQELEREKQDKLEQLQQIKLELQDKAAETERQNEEYHQKLLEAYELADQNRRAADNVLGESRQREDELRKKIDELEQQLSELKEFVSMKEEMVSKMGELREQIRVERERYEEKTRSLNQMFETEKISPHMRVDQNSNYFNRVKPSLQSVESLNRMHEHEDEDRQHHQQQQQQHYNHHLEQQQHQRQVDRLNSVSSQLNAPRNGVQSDQDLYGSKLSTRMQDGAKFAWKKSRKFASSVITGSLGGLSACRKRSDSASMRAPKFRPSNAAVAHQQQQAHLGGASGAALMVAAAAAADVTQQQQPANYNDHSSDHTSVIEVGLEQQQQQLQLNGGEQHQLEINQKIVQVDQQQQQQALNRNQVPHNNNQEAPTNTVSQHSQRDEQIHVDENNKLTIVTKFQGDHSLSHSHNHHQHHSQQSSCTSTSSGAHSPPSSAADQQPVSSAGSERSRCESSSSGRGTASSDSASASSQNGDANGAESSASSPGAKSGPAPSKESSTGAVKASTAAAADDYQRSHKRNSSLFKASGVFQGSQASLNKTFKSFLSLASPMAGKPAPHTPTSDDTSVESAAIRRHHRSFDQAATTTAPTTTGAAVPFDLASTTTFKQPPQLADDDRDHRHDSTAATTTFKQMRHLQAADSEQPPPPPSQSATIEAN